MGVFAKTEEKQFHSCNNSDNTKPILLNNSLSKVSKQISEKISDKQNNKEVKRVIFVKNRLINLLINE